jgi:LysM repeat protein
MRTRGLLLFVLLNILVTMGVAFALITFFDSREQGTAVVEYRTVVVVYTATRDPNATEEIRIITATPRPGEISTIPTGVLDDATEEVTLTPEAGNTLPPEIEADSALAGTLSVLPEGCITHVLAEGENPSVLAETYETTIEEILAANALTEEDAGFLQIGQVLVIPLENCPLEFVPVATEKAGTDTDTVDGATDEVGTVDGTEEAGVTETPAETATPTVTATITLPPTAVDAQIQIVEVIAPGDVTSEAVVLRNNGRNVNLLNWTLSDSEGNTYTFGDRNMFTNGEITLYTGSGTSTPAVTYWGLDQAVWGEPGEVVTLADADGVVQASFRVPSAVNLG